MDAIDQNVKRANGLIIKFNSKCPLLDFVGICSLSLASDLHCLTNDCGFGE